MDFKINIPQDFVLAKTLVYIPLGFSISEPIAELESAEYCANDLKINDLRVKYRVAKITPTKIGQFVTLWKRLKNGPIQPFDDTDDIDFFIISTRYENQFGQFIFPKSVLIEKGIISTKTKEGKRAIRVYPPWDIAVNTQAKKTQSWQLKYFLDISENKTIDLERAKMLFY